MYFCALLIEFTQSVTRNKGSGFWHQICVRIADGGQLQRITKFVCLYVDFLICVLTKHISILRCPHLGTSVALALIIAQYLVSQCRFFLYQTAEPCYMYAEVDLENLLAVRHCGTAKSSSPCVHVCYGKQRTRSSTNEYASSQHISLIVSIDV